MNDSTLYSGAPHHPDDYTDDCLTYFKNTNFLCRMSLLIPAFSVIALPPSHIIASTPEYIEFYNMLTYEKDYEISLQYREGENVMLLDNGNLFVYNKIICLVIQYSINNEKINYKFKSYFTFNKDAYCPQPFYQNCYFSDSDDDYYNEGKPMFAFMNSLTIELHK